MFTRVISFVLIGILLFQMGCSKTVSTIYPKPHQNPGFTLPCEVEVKLKQRTLLHGTYRGPITFSPKIKPTTWQTDKISGKLVTWNDKLASVQKQHFVYEVPIKEIEKIEVKEKGGSSTGYVCLGAYSGAVFGGIIGVLITYKVMQGREPYYEWDAELARKGLLGGVLIGTVTGGILGSQAKTPEQKNAVIRGAVITTITIVASIVVLVVYANAMASAYVP